MKISKAHTGEGVSVSTLDSDLEDVADRIF